MEIGKRLLRSVPITLILLGIVAQVNYITYAQSPDRQTTIIVSYTDYEWWLINWTENQILCQIIIDHEGLPTSSEVYRACGENLRTQWQSTPPCAQIANGESDTSACAGLYLHLASSQTKERDVVVVLPPSMVWITLDGCSPIPPENRCEQLPALTLTGEEPLPNETISAIHGTYDGQPFSCEADSCTIPLTSTPIDGVRIEFWAESSYGDSSERFTALVRVIDVGVSASPGSGGWYVDILSTQWQGEQHSCCVETWEVFPPVGGTSTWLTTPERTELMATDDAYYYLAGRLITQGVVDASICPSGGLLPNGYADACGLENARDEVEAWQNQFDARIIEVAKESGIPAQLMKNLFAQESQFWPGVFRVPFEFGLGQMTDNGADTVLLWNSSFYDQFCPLILAEDACALGYLHLKADDQAILRGALALQAKADCSDCPSGVSLNNANFSIALFADTLQANCEQVAQIIYTATNETPGSVSNYEDLWRFTVANYHAGPGCLSYAMYTAWQRTGTLDWENVSDYFTEACQGVIPYVEKISK